MRNEFKLGDIVEIQYKGVYFKELATIDKSPRQGASLSTKLCHPFLRCRVGNNGITAKSPTWSNWDNVKIYEP